MICPNCSAKIEEHAVSCPSCGSALPQGSSGGDDSADAAKQEALSQACASDGSGQDQNASTSYSSADDSSKEQVIEVGEVRVGGSCSSCGEGPLTYRRERRKTVYTTKDYLLPVFFVVAGLIGTIALFVTQGFEGVFLDKAYRGMKILIVAVPVGFALRIWRMRKGYKDVVICSCPSCGIEYPVENIPEEGTW